ncbi:hypothetical protein BC940DRAFT_317289 [Gongronella butleri]|nr:hypothetical protein BC940DRAFT_317289 [Gongronella butleri]
MLKQPVPVFIPKPKLIIQKRKTPAAESKSLAPMPRISPLVEDDKEKHVQCPYCHADLTSNEAPVLPSAVQEALDAIRAADAAHAARRAQMIREGKFVDARDKDRKVHPHAKFRFCQLHTLELETKPLAAKHGYPVVLDRDALAASVRKSEKDLKAIIDRELDSQFREKAEQLYTQMSVHKVRNQESVMARFHEYLPGYYGPQGAEVIMNELQAMFLTKPVYLTKEKAHPQLPSEYVQQVLVPEAAARAIQRDRGISYDRAVATMHDTQDMGSKLFPIIESDNDASDAEDDANRDENDTDHDQDDESD